MSLDYDLIKHQEDKTDSEKMLGSFSDLFAALSFIFLFLFAITTINKSLEVLQGKLSARRQTASLQKRIVKYEKQIDEYKSHIITKDKIAKGEGTIDEGQLAEHKKEGTVEEIVPQDQVADEKEIITKDQITVEKEIITKDQPADIKPDLYQAVRSDYLETDTSREEADFYASTLSQFSKMKDEYTQDKQALKQLMKNLSQKEEEMAKHQKKLDDIITLNLVMKSKLKAARDENQEMETQQQYIALKAENLEKDLKEDLQKEYEKELFQQINTFQVEMEKSYLQEKMKLAHKAEKSFVERFKKVKQTQLATLEEKDEHIQELKGDLTYAKDELLKTKALYLKAKHQLEKQHHDIQKQVQLENLKYKQQLQEEKKAAISSFDQEYEKSLDKIKLENQTRIKHLSKKIEQEYQKELGEQIDKMKDIRDKTMKTKAREIAVKKQLEKKQIELAATEDLKKSIRPKVKRHIIRNLKENFKKDRIDAKVNEITGEVTIEFPEIYFDYGKYKLKEHMMVLLNKVIPSYAKSLFQDKHIARKIKLVELIGFASPTYQGMYIGDNYNTDLGRDSIHFNMDLSSGKHR